MLFGLTADRFRMLSAADVLRLFRWNGLRFAEVTTAVFRNPDKACKNAGILKLGLHLPNAGNRGYDFSSEKHSAAIQHDLMLIRRHREKFDFQYAVFHLPEAEGSRGVSGFFIQNLRRVEVPLVLENTCGYTPEIFFKRYQWLKVKLGNRLWGICLDIPHAHLTNRRWEAYYGLLRPHIRVIHLSDCKDGEDKHLPFGLGGELSLKSILSFLGREGYDGFLNFEILPPSLPKMLYLFPMIRRVRGFLGVDHSIH